MRDIVLTLILGGMLPVSLRKPFVGALMFAMISMLNPHRMTWGFAYSLPWAMAFASVTILGLLTTQERAIGDSIRRYLPILLYLSWMGVTTAFALEHEAALSRWIEVIKVHVMCLVTLSLLTDWERIKKLVWVAACSIGFYGLKGGVFTLVSGGEHLVWGPLDSVIQDNNHLAVGLVMTLPMIYWLYTEATKKWLRWLLLFSALMTVVSIFGSHSRSAFLGIAAMSFFMLLKSQHKFAVGIIAVIGAAGLLAFMPEQYWNRMETIKTYDQDDSAMQRIYVWQTAFNIANDRVTGAGFEYYTRDAFDRYAPHPGGVHSSHSIYFQALGEHGWIGLALFLSFWSYIWLTCRRVIKRADSTEDGRSQALLARMIQVGLVGYAVGGSFVNIGNWDMTYYLAICVLGMARLLDASARRRPEERIGARRAMHSGRLAHEQR